MSIRPFVLLALALFLAGCQVRVGPTPHFGGGYYSPPVRSYYSPAPRYYAPAPQHYGRGWHGGHRGWHGDHRRHRW